MFEILGEATVPIEPCESALDDPAPRQQYEALGGIGAFDDLQCPFSNLGERVAELVASVAAIGKNMAQPWEALADVSQHQRRTVYR